MSDKGDFKTPVVSFPQRVKDAFTDPLRLRNVISSVVERTAGVWVSFGVFNIAYLFAPWWVALICSTTAGILAMLFLYEFVLEPLGLTGHYWERGPRDGEEFKNP